MIRVLTLAPLILACGGAPAHPVVVDGTSAATVAGDSTVAPAPFSPGSESSYAVAPLTSPDPIEWQLMASSTTFTMSARGDFMLWIVARNTGEQPADTRRDRLEYLVNDHPSFDLPMAFGNGLREERWLALPPDETIREARGGPNDASFGRALFPAPGAYDLSLRQGGRTVASLRVHVTTP